MKIKILVRDDKDLSKNKNFNRVFILFIPVLLLIFLYYIFFKDNEYSAKNEDSSSIILKQKELELKEKELQFREKEINSSGDYKHSIKNLLYDWINSIQNKNDISKYYSSEVNYYSGGIVPLSRILSDKARFYEKWDQRKFELSNIDIYEITNNKYKVVYDKAFDCMNSSNENVYNGKVRSVLIFENIRNRMLITDEHDEKIYYTNKSK